MFNSMTKSKRKFLNVSGAKPVSEQIKNYLPTIVWVDACETIVELTKGILRDTLGYKWSVVPQGSFVQGLQLVGSDLDLVVLDGTDRWRVLNRKKNADELDSAVRALCRAGYTGFRVQVIRKIYSARVPLARLRITLGQPATAVVEVDMCFGDPARGSCDLFVHRALTDQCTQFVLAMKIWATSRNICVTHMGGISCFAIVLMAIFHFDPSLPFVELVKSFFAFFHALSQGSFSVVLERMQLERRDDDADFFHVAVPCRAGENAARCLTRMVWQRTVVPELARGILICNSHDGDLIDELINKSVSQRDILNVRFDNQPTLAKLGVRAKSEDTEEEYSSDDLSSMEGLLNFKPRTVKRPELDEFEANTKRFKTEPIAAKTSAEKKSQTKPSTALTILECPDCDYSCLTNTALTNHKFAVHKYVPVEKPSSPISKYKVAKRFREMDSYVVPPLPLSHRKC